MKILLEIPLSTFSGYGNDGIGMVKALLRAGVDVHLAPTLVQPPLPQEIAALMTKEAQAPFDLILSHVDPFSLSMTPERSQAATMTVGWTMWESSNMRNTKGRSSHRKRWKDFDALVGYDHNSAEGLKEYYSGPVLIQQGGFMHEEWKPLERDWDSPEFYFCQIGVLSERKDPFVSIQAFAELRQEHADFAEYARLMMKTSMPGLHSKMEDVFPGLRIFYDSWPVETVREFYRGSHVLLAPSRGEGKNMPALEFLSTGGTVIATDWGGHTQWLHPDYAYPLDYILKPVSAKYPDTYQAHASVEHMKELMLHAFRNRDEVRRKGEIGAQVVPQMSSWDSVLGRLFEKLREVGPAGVEVHRAFETARWEATRT